MKSMHFSKGGFWIKGIITFLFLGFCGLIASRFLPDFRTESLDGIAIKSSNVKVFDDKIEITGMIVNSSKYFKSYEYYTKGGQLFLKIYTAYIKDETSSNKGDVDILIKINTSTIKQIYLQGKSNKDIKLLWKK